MRPLSLAKSLVVPKGSRPRRIKLGLYRGIAMDIDLAHRTQLYLGLWERETYALLREAARHCRWAIDVGAGAGELCLYLLRHSGAKPIFAFEPNAVETGLLARNVALNGFAAEGVLKVSNDFVGLAAEPGFAALDSLGIDRSARGLVKIDVDGAEMDVLRSGERLFAEAPIDLLLETHTAQLEKDCLAWLQAKGFACRIIDKAWWRAIVPERRPLEHNRWIWASSRRPPVGPS